MTINQDDGRHRGAAAAFSAGQRDDVNSGRCRREIIESA
jgi:hypothetical protein